MASVETRDFRDQTTRPREGDSLAMQPREEERSAEVVTGGSMIEAVGGIATVVLAIVGLAGLVPIYLAAIAAIVLGAALLLQGIAIAARFSDLLAETAGTHVANGQLGHAARFTLAAAAPLLRVRSALGCW